MRGENYLWDGRFRMLQAHARLGLPPPCVERHHGSRERVRVRSRPVGLGLPPWGPLCAQAIPEGKWYVVVSTSVVLRRLRSSWLRGWRRRQPAPTFAFPHTTSSP